MLGETVGMTWTPPFWEASFWTAQAFCATIVAKRFPGFDSRMDGTPGRLAAPDSTLIQDDRQHQSVLLLRNRYIEVIDCIWTIPKICDYRIFVEKNDKKRLSKTQTKKNYPFKLPSFPLFRPVEPGLLMCNLQIGLSIFDHPQKWSPQRQDWWWSYYQLHHPAWWLSLP